MKARCDAVQGGKEKTEAELLQCIKQRREAQLAWNQQRDTLEQKAQVRRSPHIQHLPGASTSTTIGAFAAKSKLTLNKPVSALVMKGTSSSLNCAHA